jgi:hypothetical protein
MQSNSHPFTIICPSCKNKQTGFIQSLSYAFNQSGWSCIVKGCCCWLNADELANLIEITVGDIKIEKNK